MERKIRGISKFPGKKDNGLSIYLILCRKFRLNSPVVTHEEALRTNLFACGQLHAGRCSPRARELLLPSVLFERSMCPWRSGRASF